VHPCEPYPNVPDARDLLVPVPINSSPAPVLGEPGATETDTYASTGISAVLLQLLGSWADVGAQQRKV
jgi:hypothetical protein